jgi:hypothetical protein
MLNFQDKLSYKSLYSRYETTKEKFKYDQFLAGARLLSTRARLLYLSGVVVFGLLIFSALPGSKSNLKNYYCFGPAMSPLDMDINKYSEWHRSSPSPVKFNTHNVIEYANTSIRLTDLNLIQSTRDAVANRERVLILTPLRDASPYLSKYFELLMALTYPHSLIDLGFLVSDTNDETLAILSSELDNLQSGSNPFNSVDIFQKDFGMTMDNLDVEERHSFEAQGPRRKAMARARNYLLYSALKPEHSWVLWRDVDIVESPPSILEDFIKHDTDVLVPNIWFHRFRDGKDIEGRFDYNSWVESSQGLALAASLDKDVILVEGYKEYQTGREYMARMGDWRYNNDEEIELDGVGGVNIVVKADVHRSGINFPCYPFENQAETEGFAKMAKRAGYRVVGLPNYVVWHIDTDEKPGNG